MSKANTHTMQASIPLVMFRQHALQGEGVAWRGMDWGIRSCL